MGEVHQSLLLHYCTDLKDYKRASMDTDLGVRKKFHQVGKQ